jgi:glutamate racemase
MPDSRPIGLFDSGVGGLTVAAEIFSQLPNEEIYYFGDTCHIPYGSKTPAQLNTYATEILEFLAEKQIKLAVMACSTSSAVVLNRVKNKYAFDILGVILPGSLAAISATKNKRVGVIGTKVTIVSQAYSRVITSLDGVRNVYGKACPKLVPLVERGEVYSKRARRIVDEYLIDLKRAKIDTLVLGCTHYPFLKNIIQESIGENINLINPSFHTVQSIKELLVMKDMLRKDRTPPRHQFFVSKGPQLFKSVGEKFLGRSIERVTEIDLSKKLALV